MKGAVRIAIVVAAGALVSCAPLTAQGEQRTGVSGDASPELARLAFLVGDWTVRSFTRDERGEFVEVRGVTWYRARYLYDGLSILAEFYGDDRDGFYGVHLISHGPETGLVHDYLNARAGRRLEFRGAFEGDEYHLTRAGGYGGGDFLYREVDSEIGTSSFVKRIYQSSDDGQTWVEGDYYFRFERIVSR